MSPITCSLSAVHGGALLLLLGTQLEGLAAPQVLHLERRALLALHLERDLLGHLPNHVESDSAHESSAKCRPVECSGLPKAQAHDHDRVPRTTYFNIAPRTTFYANTATPP